MHTLRQTREVSNNIDDIPESVLPSSGNTKINKASKVGQQPQNSSDSLREQQQQQTQFPQQRNMQQQQQTTSFQNHNFGTHQQPQDLIQSMTLQNIQLQQMLMTQMLAGHEQTQGARAKNSAQMSSFGTQTIISSDTLLKRMQTFHGGKANATSAVNAGSATIDTRSDENEVRSVGLNRADLGDLRKRVEKDISAERRESALNSGREKVKEQDSDLDEGKDTWVQEPSTAGFLGDQEYITRQKIRKRLRKSLLAVCFITRTSIFLRKRRTKLSSTLKSMQELSIQEWMRHIIKQDRFRKAIETIVLASNDGTDFLPKHQGLFMLKGGEAVAKMCIAIEHLIAAIDEVSNLFDHIKSENVYFD